MDPLPYLVKKSIAAYNDGGVKTFTKRVGNYLTPTNQQFTDLLLFNPIVPPVGGLRYWRSRLALGYRGKYLYNGIYYQILPEPDDTVVEAGVYKGRDTAMFAKLADRVIGFEPSPRNIKEAKHNLQKYENIELINAGLWNEEDELSIKYGVDEIDDGFFEPDSGSGKKVEKIPVDTLESYTGRLGLDGIDYLKIEAEGAEPEIIEGLGEFRPRNIVVNADEERDGKPTGRQIMELLQPMGYNLVSIKFGCVLFFTYDEVDNDAFRSEFS